MIDKESTVFSAVATALRAKYTTIYIIGAELENKPPRFPAVSFQQINNAINNNYSTFNSLENVVKEEYKAEVFSNLTTGKTAQAKAIVADIDTVMVGLGYERTFNEPVANVDSSLARRIARFVKNNVV